MHRWKLIAAIAFTLLTVVHSVSIPRSIWEFDESFFAMGVEHYAPLVHHPPPPGYPIYMAFAKIVALFTANAFQALIVTSVIGLTAGLVFWFLAFRQITDDPLLAILATGLLYLSPAILVSGTLPQSDSGALALLGLAAWACARREPHFAALACAACIGWRLQFSIAVVPMLFATVFSMDTWRQRRTTIATFAAGCFVWFMPLVVATGGPESFWKWLSGQAAYYADHDADLSRSGYSFGLIGLRFIAHPWGPKWLSMPLLVIAAAGAVMLVRKKQWKFVPLLVSSAVYFAFALATMDPADAVRYAIPALPVVALLAAVPLLHVRLVGMLLAISYCTGAVDYASPVLSARAKGDAPPAAAAEWARANLPKDTVVLYDLPLRPHAEYLLRGYRSMRIDAGLARFGGDVNVPMVIYADGERGSAPGVTFRWPDTDAYRKLTRQHYGAVSMIPLPPHGRYRVVSGIFPPERTRDGEAWRWVADRGVIELPHLGASQVRLRFRAPKDYTLGENRIDVTIHGRTASTSVQTGAESELVLPIPRGKVLITIEPEKHFVPAKSGGNNRDARTLSVMLTHVEQF